ncbi:MAG: leucyl aminopeptidase [Bacteroidia bacterium]|nr:leucyl aminopeptidase [Bacteroidia bacterium]
MINLNLTDQLPAFTGKQLLALLSSPKENFPQSGRYSSLEAQLGSGYPKKGSKRMLVFDGRPIIILGLGSMEAEEIRKAVHQAVATSNEMGFEELILDGLGNHGDYFKAATEAALLSSYNFDHYKGKAGQDSLKQLTFLGNGVEESISEGKKIAEATCHARDLVNEPLVTLTAVEMSRRIEKLGKQYGFAVEVLHKGRIQSLKMGGLLAVNRGSEDPPTFSILEYKPENPSNDKPIILVGKGVVYDTGGLSLKPTANSMDFMKADMGGAAAVIGAFCGIAALGLNKHVIGLVPSTDNRPGKNAYVPGDVIKMFDGSTVEVLNTDAEGRMLLADALAYAKKYDPKLVIDLATLTGAKVVAIGSVGLAMMANKIDEETRATIKASGERVYERLVEFPLWEEYGAMLKSDIADRKNIGGREAGSITAAKFLEHFTDYPWIHLDIAGSAFSHKPDGYRGKNGTGVGVRLLIDFISQI